MLGLIQVAEVARRRHGTYDDAAESRRQTTICYTVPTGRGDHVQVCRNTFSEIFALSHCKVQGLVKKKKSGSSIYVDNRGWSKGPRKFTEDIRQQVIDHINSFPKEENHYSRLKSNKEFLSPDLNIHRMFIAFGRRYPNSAVNYRFYSKVFKKNFPNLRFGRPRSDTCSTCDLLSNKMKTNPQDRRELSARLELHHRKAESARNKLLEDSTASQQPTSDTMVISMDLEQVIFIPTLTHSDMFYSRQLSCFNFGLHVADNNSAVMCLWTEAITGRGGNEIGSALLKVLLSENFTPKDKIIIWSDNCIGQNKNRMILMIFIYLIVIGKFTQIEQKFLVTGHTYLPCDRDFAQIEKRKRVTKLIVPADIEKMILECCHKTPFKVSHVEEQDFKNIQQLADEYINTSKLNISQTAWVRISADDPGRIYVRKSFSDACPWESHNVLKKGKRLSDLRLQPLPPLQCHNRITAAKLENLKSMLDYIPLANVRFYEELIAKTTEQGVMK